MLTVVLCGCDVSVYVPTTLLPIVSDSYHVIHLGAVITKMLQNWSSKLSVLQVMIPFILQSAVQSIVQSSMVLHSLMTGLGIWISAVVSSSLSVVVGSRSVIYFWNCCNMVILIFSLYL